MNQNHLNAIDWTTLNKKIQKLASSQKAQEAIENLEPFENKEKAKERLEQIGETLSLIQRGQRPLMESLDLVHTWLSFLNKGAQLRSLQIKDIRFFCFDILSCKEVLQDFPSSSSLKILDHSLFDSEPLIQSIDQKITPDGEIRSDATDRLYQLENEKKRQTQNIKKQLDQIVKLYKMEPILQDRYVTTREGRWVLPVKSGKQHDFEGIIHTHSQSKQTVFMEPSSVIKINNSLREIEASIEEEIHRILTILSNEIKTWSRDLEKAYTILLNFDQLLAFAQFQKLTQSHPPEFSDSEMNLNGLRHPLLILSQDNVISNNIQLSTEKRILILSGPNAGGKTVLLKSVGLALHMARCGLPLCTESPSTIPFIRELHISIGDSQSVSDALSTFAAHLKILDQATQVKGPHHFLLIDEICGSTDPEEGTALARSFIEQFSANKTLAVMTSHLSGLKKGWTNDSAVINGSMEFSSLEDKPSYQLILGIPGQSMAIKAAQRAGVRSEIIEKAYRFLDPHFKNYQWQLEELEGLKVNLLKERESLQKEKILMTQTLQEYKEKMADFEQKRTHDLELEIQRLQGEVQRQIQLARVSQSFQKHEALQQIQYNIPKMIKLDKIKKNKNPETAQEFIGLFPPGSKVYVQTLGRNGVIQGTPNSKGDIPILSESVRLVLNWKLLSAPEGIPNSVEKKSRYSSSFAGAFPSETTVIDLRGMTVSEALIHLEKELDRAVVDEDSRIKVIHGHGLTDSLKQSIRTYLSRSPYVAHWNSGNNLGEGDGVTWVHVHA